MTTARDRRSTREAPMPPAPAGFADAIDSFLGFVELERGLSRNTAQSYESDLKQASHILRRQGAASWVKVTAKHLAAWLHWLSDEGFTESSQARKLSAVRMLCRHLVREGRRPDDPTALLGAPKVRRKLPQTLTPGEMDRLLAAPSGGDAYALRDRAMLELFYSSGLRISELCALTLQQADLDHGFVRVFGKGSKERVVPLGKKAIAALRVYLDSGRPRLVKPRTGSELFVSERGKAISRKTLWVIVKKAAVRAGLEKSVKPHLLGGGADLRAIQEMLGHASIGTTQIYTAVEGSRLLDQHTKHHPRNRPATTAAAPPPPPRRART